MTNEITQVDIANNGDIVVTGYYKGKAGHWIFTQEDMLLYIELLELGEQRQQSAK